MWRVNYIFIIVSLLFCVCFYDYIDIEIGFSYLDELLVLYLFIIWLRKGRTNKEFAVFFRISFFFLFYSFIQSTNVWQAIIVDYIIEVKPYITFYCAYSISFNLTITEKKQIRKWCVALSILFIPIGIEYLAGGTFVYTLFGHPSRYCTTYQILGVLYIINSDHSIKYLKRGALIIALSLLGGKSKAYGFFTVYLFLIYFPKLMKYRHLFNYKNVTTLIIISFSVFYVAREKIIYYFVTGSQSEEMFARPLLFTTCWRILMDFPLLGSGLGSFATYASAEYYSPVYYWYGLSEAEGLNPDDPSFICDTFFPVFAQFGFVGILLFVIFWLKRLKFANKLRLEGELFVFMITVLLVAFFIFEGIADSTFIQNRGVYVMMLYGFVLSNTRKRKLSVQ